jgi:hypothetical protein
MNVVNGKEREVVELLRGYGLCDYEAKVYFTLLAVGESKAGDVARKARHSATPAGPSRNSSTAPAAPPQRPATSTPPASRQTS